MTLRDRLGEVRQHLAHLHLYDVELVGGSTPKRTATEATHAEIGTSEREAPSISTSSRSTSSNTSSSMWGSPASDVADGATDEMDDKDESHHHHHRRRRRRREPSSSPPENSPTFSPSGLALPPSPYATPVGEVLEDDAGWGAEMEQDPPRPDGRRARKDHDHDHDHNQDQDQDQSPQMATLGTAQPAVGMTSTPTVTRGSGGRRGGKKSGSGSGSGRPRSGARGSPEKGMTNGKQKGTRPLPIRDLAADFGHN